MGYILTSEGGWLGPIIWVFGKLMNGIFLILDKFGIGNIGLAIIIFTFITRLILHPFTLKQQQSTKMMTVIQPEIKAIQKKYEGRQDQQSMLLQQQEIKAVYEKYGTSMTGSCLQLMIQMPIIFALYRVIMNIPAYVGTIKDSFMKIVDAMINDVGSVDKVCGMLTEFATKEQNQRSLKAVLTQVKNFGANNANITELAKKDYIIDFLYKLNPNQIKELSSEFGQSVQNVFVSQTGIINKLNSFLSMNLATAPSANGFNIFMLNQDGTKMFNIYLLIPIFAFLSQFISAKLMQSAQNAKKVQNKEDDPMAQSMQSMMIMMPIMSAVFTWGFATGLGVYWIASAVILCLQQMIINKQMQGIDLDKMIKQNIEKANKKRAKKGLPLLDTNVTVNSIKKQAEKEKENEEKRENILKNQVEKQKSSQDFYFSGEENPNSLFAKANMVKKYNEKHND